MAGDPEDPRLLDNWPPFETCIRWVIIIHVILFLYGGLFILDNYIADWYAPINWLLALVKGGFAAVSRVWMKIIANPVWLMKILGKRAIAKAVLSGALIALPVAFKRLRRWHINSKQKLRERLALSKQQWENASTVLKWTFFALLLLSGVGLGIALFFIPIPKWFLRMLALEEKVAGIASETAIGSALKKKRRLARRLQQVLGIRWARYALYRSARGIRKRRIRRKRRLDRIREEQRQRRQLTHSDNREES